MSDSHWRINPVAGCLVGVALLLFAAPLLQQFGGRQASYPGANYERGYSDQVTEPILDPAGVAEPKVAEAESRKEQREIDDLRAQREMAFWAALMFCVTSIGVVYVARTLDEARATTAAANAGTVAANSTTDLTRTMGQAQTRAYMAPEHGRIRYEDRRFIAEVTFRNSGATPALYPEFSWTIIVHVSPNLLQVGRQGIAQRWLGKSAQGAKWSFRLSSA